LEKNGLKAIGTSSAALANALGYEDGEKMPFKELLFMVERIIKCIRVPLSVDMETGYSSDPAAIISNLEKLYQLGVVGINIEDSILADKRALVSVEEFSQKLSYIKNNLAARNIQLFLNVRTDAYLRGVSTPLKTTLERISAYEQAGADGIFVPGIENTDDIHAVVSSTSLPIHVLCMPNLPSFSILAELGVKRISMGDFVYNALCRDFETTIKNIVTEQSFTALF
jgi:2-methylisocitrate lyase-like PEP mutase family enzyme